MMSWINNFANGNFKRIWQDVEGGEFLNDPYELRRVLDALESVVPRLSGSDAGEGPLTQEVFATSVDWEILNRCVERGDYAKAIKSSCKVLGCKFVGPTAPDKATEALVWAARALELAHLQHEYIQNPDLEPNDSVLETARDIALETLEVEGFPDADLDETFVIWDKQKKAWIGSDNMQLGKPLRCILDGRSSTRRTRLRIAVEILTYFQEYQRELSVVQDVESPEERWTDREMQQLAKAAAMAAFEIGRRIEALHAKGIERAAETGAKVIRGGEKSSQIRAKNSKVSRAIEMLEIFLQDHKLSVAAQMVCSQKKYDKDPRSLIKAYQRKLRTAGQKSATVAAG